MTPKLDCAPVSRARVPGGGERDTSDGSPADSLERIRGEIDQVDETIVQLLVRRGRLAGAARVCKERLGQPLFDPAREAAIVRRAAELAAEGNLDPEIVRDVFWRIVELARVTQLGQAEGS